MDDIIFQYFILSSFVLAIFKSAIKGATSELISLIFTIVGIIFGAFFYKPDFRSISYAFIAFLVVYSIGLYVAYKYRRAGVLEILFGIIIGTLKFILLLTITTSIALALENTPSTFLDNKIIQYILPYAEYLKTYLI